MTQQVEVLLLVEDNASDAEMIIRALTKTNLASKLFHAKDGAEALDFIFAQGSYESRAPAGTPKLVLLDLKMSKVNGKEVLKKLKSDERTRRIPVVILTSSREPQDIKECYDLGANGFVVKPVGFDEFTKVISDLGKYWLVMNEPPKQRVIQMARN